MPKQKALLDSYPEPFYADGKRLKILREDLRIGQVELAKLAGISQVAISRIESGVRPFTKGARNKIWPVVAKLLDQHVEGWNLSMPGFPAEYEKQQRERKRLERAKESGKQKHGLLSELTNRSSLEALKAAYASESPLLTIEQRLQRAKAMLEGELQATREMIAGKDAQIATLIKALDAALQANADYAKLFALKGAAVAADELQQGIESRQRKDSDDE